MVLTAADQDRAREDNGIGWSGFDSDIGHRLAAKAQAGRLNPWDRLRAYNKLHRYRKQLERAGLDFSGMKPPPEPIAPEPVREVSVVKEGVYAGWFSVKVQHVSQPEWNQYQDQRSMLAGRRVEVIDGVRVTLVPPDGSSARTMAKFIERTEDFAVEAQVGERFEELFGKAERFAKMSRAVEPSAEWEATDPRMFDAQKAGEEYVLAGMAERLTTGEGSGVLIGDDMGTGKTATDLLSAYRAGAFTTGILGRKGMLVICPAGIKLNWELEAHHWLGRCIDPDCRRGPVCREASCPDAAPDKDHRHPAHRPGPDGEAATWDRMHRCWNVAEPLVPDFSVQVLDGINAQMIMGDLVVANYDILRWQKGTEDELNDVSMFLSMRNWAAISCDEFHACKNPEAMRTKVVNEIIGAVSPPFLTGMTGTFVLNRTAEAFPQLKILDCLTHFGSGHAAEARYVHGSPEDKQEFNRKLRELGCYLQRPKRSQVMDPQQHVLPLDKVPSFHLPDRLRVSGQSGNMVAKEHLAEARSILEGLGYEWIAGAMDAELQNRIEQVEIMEADETKMADYERCLREFQTWYATELQGKFGDGWGERWKRGMNGEALVKLNKLREATVRVKLKSSARWAETIIESGEKLVLFTCHEESRAYLMKKLAPWSPASIYGGMTPAQKQESIREFQTNPRCMVIVVQLLSGGEGINLTAAHHVAIVETYWNGGKIDQAAARVDRGGQDHDVVIHHLYADQTVDRKMAERCQKKALETAAVINGGEVETSKLWVELMDIALGVEPAVAA
jgi:hypothetical protein